MYTHAYTHTHARTPTYTHAYLLTYLLSLLTYFIFSILLSIISPPISVLRKLAEYCRISQEFSQMELMQCSHVTQTKRNVVVVMLYVLTDGISTDND